MRLGRVFGTFSASDDHLLTLRSLTTRDTEAALAFINDLVSERQENPELGIVADTAATRKTEKEFLERITRGIRENNIANVAAFEGKKLVGNCEVRRDRFKDSAHHGYLGIAIRRGYRGMRIGETMMGVLLRNCEEIGLESVQLEVFANNSHAIRLYKKMGFRRVGVIPGKIRLGRTTTDSIVMFAEL